MRPNEENAPAPQASTTHPMPAAERAIDPSAAAVEAISPPDPASAGTAIQVASHLAVNPGWPNVPDLDMIAQYAAGLRVTLKLPRPTVERLQRLHEEMLLLEVDEISDWAVDAGCVVEPIEPKPAGARPAHAIGVGATVYATGEIHFSVNFQDLEHTLWLKDTVELDELLRAVAPSQSP